MIVGWYASDSGISTFVNVGSPERYSIAEVPENSVRRKSGLEMARQEKMQLEAMIEMFAKMRDEDRQEREKERQDREQERRVMEEKCERERRENEERREKERLEREREERIREERREERQQQMILQLRASQPAVPQTVQITQSKLPVMTEKDDVEAFVNQLEIAMKSAGLPRTKWKHHMLTQLTVPAKEPIVALLDDEHVEYEEVKEALLSRKITSHAAAAEAYYSFNNRELLNLPLTQVFLKLKRWVVKMEEGAGTEDLRREKYVMGHVRSQLVPELKMLLDISKPQTAAEFEALVEQWSMSQPSKRPIYVSKATYSNKPYTYEMGTQGTYKKPVTCYACGKTGHMAKECRSKTGETPKVSIPPTRDVKPITCFICKEVGPSHPSALPELRKR